MAPDALYHGRRILARGGEDGRAELDLDAMAARQEAPRALGPVAAGRHRVMGAADVDRDDRDLVLLGDDRGAGAQPADPAVARPRALGVDQQVPAPVDQLVDV